MKNNRKILIVDDDEHISEMLKEALIKEHYEVLQAYSGTEAALVFEKEKPDLILLDLMLPGKSGEALLPDFKDVPVIIISAKSDLDNKVNLLTDGAADYLTKPFYIPELLARIKLCLKNAAKNVENSVLQFGGLILEPDARIVSNGASIVKLTPTECAILRVLIENSGATVTKSLLIKHISEFSDDGTEDSLKVHISRLRKKLAEINFTGCIESVWGVGFLIKQNLN